MRISGALRQTCDLIRPSQDRVSFDVPSNECDLLIEKKRGGVAARFSGFWTPGYAMTLIRSRFSHCVQPLDCVNRFRMFNSAASKGRDQAAGG